MEPYDFIICDCISQCSEMKVQSWLNFVRCFRWYHRDVWWPLGQAGRAQQDLWPPEVPKRRMGVRWGLGALIPGQRRTSRCSARGTWCYVSKILQTSGFGWKLVSIHPKIDSHLDFEMLFLTATSQDRGRETKKNIRANSNMSLKQNVHWIN